MFYIHTIWILLLFDIFFKRDLVHKSKRINNNLNYQTFNIKKYNNHVDMHDTVKIYDF